MFLRLCRFFSIRDAMNRGGRHFDVGTRAGRLFELRYVYWYYRIKFHVDHNNALRLSICELKSHIRFNKEIKRVNETCDKLVKVLNEVSTHSEKTGD